MKTLLWIQKRDETESSVIIADGTVYRENDNEYQYIDITLSKKLRGRKWSYLPDMTKISMRWTSVALSGSLEQMDVWGRNMIFTYYQHGTKDVVSNIEKQLPKGLSISQDTKKRIDQHIAEKRHLQRKMLFGAGVVAIMVGVFCLINHCK